MKDTEKGKEIGKGQCGKERRSCMCQRRRDRVKILVWRTASDEENKKWDQNSCGEERFERYMGKISQ